MMFQNFVPTVLSNEDSVQFIDGNVNTKLGDYAPVPEQVNQLAYPWIE